MHPQSSSSSSSSRCWLLTAQTSALSRGLPSAASSSPTAGSNGSAPHLWVAQPRWSHPYTEYTVKSGWGWPWKPLLLLLDSFPHPITGFPQEHSFNKCYMPKDPRLRSCYQATDPTHHFTDEKTWGKQIVMCLRSSRKWESWNLKPVWLANLCSSHHTVMATRPVFSGQAPPLARVIPTSGPLNFLFFQCFLYFIVAYFLTYVKMSEILPPQGDLSWP